LTKLFDENRPIFQQVREKIEDQIINGQLKEGEQAPSTNQLADFYRINHITVLKGINQLVEEGILFKKRGIGMFVAAGAKEKLLIARKGSFVEDYVIPLVEEADKLRIPTEEIIEMVKKVKGGNLP